MNNNSLSAAITLWKSNRQQALQQYGPIGQWDVSNVDSMAGLFYNNSDYILIINPVRSNIFIGLDTCDKELVSGCYYNIPDKSITASSKYSYLYRPENARLNTK